MHLSLVLAILATLVLAERAPEQSVPHAAWRVTLALGGMSVVVVLAMVVSAGTVKALRHDYQGRIQWLRDFDRWRKVHFLLLLFIVGWIHFGLGWNRLVRANWRLDQWPLADDVMLLLPLVLPLLLSWAAFFDVDRALQVPSLHDDWRWHWQHRFSFVSCRARHYLGLILLPVLGLLATCDVAEYLVPGILAGEQAWIVYFTPLAIAIVTFPFWLRLIWPTHRLAEQPLRRRLEDTAGRCGVAVRDILVWRTDCGAMNAALAGLFPPLRYIFLTDGVLARLTEDDIDAVFLHEAAHARHHHLALRILVVLVPLSVWHAAHVWHATGLQRASQFVSAWGIDPASAGSLMATLVAAAYLVITLSWYSRLLEHQADLWACRQLALAAEPGGQDVFKQAVARYVTTLTRLLGDDALSSTRLEWLHPSLRSRVQFLTRIASEPRREVAFHRSVRCVGVIILAIAVLPLAFTWVV